MGGSDGRTDDPAGRAREGFEDAFEELQARSAESADLDRESADFETLVRDHTELEEVRRQARAAKKDIASRYEPPTPDFVEQPLGYSESTGFGRVLAVLGAVAIAAIVPIVWIVFLASRPDVDARVVDSAIVRDESGTCRLDLSIEVVNDSDRSYVVDRLGAVIDRRRRAFQASTPDVLVSPDGTPRPLDFTVRLGDDDPCPTLDDLSMTRLGLTLTRTDPDEGGSLRVGVDR